MVAIRLRVGVVQTESNLKLGEKFLLEVGFLLLDPVMLQFCQESLALQSASTIAAVSSAHSDALQRRSRVPVARSRRSCTRRSLPVTDLPQPLPTGSPNRAGLPAANSTPLRFALPVSKRVWNAPTASMPALPWGQAARATISLRSQG